MKASELIELLHKAIAEHGDLDMAADVEGKCNFFEDGLRFDADMNMLVFE